MRQSAFLEEGLRFADEQWATPLDNGLSSQSRYWIDDVWMMGILQVQAWRATGEAIYLDRPRITGDFHGQAPLLWFATELLAP